MSGQNTKASKIERILKRVTDIDVNSKAHDALAETIKWQAATIKMLSTTNQMLTATAQSLEADNSRLRKYLGSVLFKRRRLESASDVSRRLEPHWGNR